MTQPHPEKAPLSVQRAFVVHFRTNSDIARDQIEGRVEHVVSGQLSHFASLEELLAFIARVFDQQAEQGAGRRSGAMT